MGMGSPWPALWELARGNDWRRLREVRREFNPRTEPVVTGMLLAQAFVALGDVAGAEGWLHQAATGGPAEGGLVNALGELLERQRPSRHEWRHAHSRAS